MPFPSSVNFLCTFHIWNKPIHYISNLELERRWNKLNNNSKISIPLPDMTHELHILHSVWHFLKDKSCFAHCIISKTNNVFAVTAKQYASIIFSSHMKSRKFATWILTWIQPKCEILRLITQPVTCCLYLNTVWFNNTASKSKVKYQTLQPQILEKRHGK